MRDRVKELIDDYEFKVRVVPVYIYTDRSLIEERLKRDGFSQETIDFRMQRSEMAWQDYLEHSAYIRIIINNSNVSDFRRRINALMEEFANESELNTYIYINPKLKFELIKPLIGFKAAIVNKLALYPYEKNVFLMMKYRDSNKEFYNYIQNELNNHGYNCVRADDPKWNITNNVYNPLAVLYCCKYGIALFDEPEEKAHYNPNVAYELGIMHYQNKNCLILKHEELTDMPFDLIKDLYKEYSKEIQFNRIFSDWLISIR